MKEIEKKYKKHIEIVADVEKQYQTEFKRIMKKICSRSIN